MDQFEFLTITRNLLKAREKSRVEGAIGFDFAFHWLKNWFEIFKPMSVSIAIVELLSTVIWKLLCNELWSEAKGWPDRPR